MEENMIVTENEVVEVTDTNEVIVEDKKEFHIDAESAALGAAGAAGLFLAGLTVAKKLKNKKASKTDKPVKEKKQFKLFQKKEKKQTVESELSSTIAEGNEVKKKLSLFGGKKNEASD